ncbi:MAG: 6,7-dimethyl-8-ribityllumazine synthase [Proteobacteria bacterium]|nr:6,7-dimethyl-8-ribityllumazine synthase [Pseudomonadota bacterium]
MSPAASAAAPVHVLIVEARFYEDIADELVRGAVGALERAGATYERLSVPGAFEIPGAIAFVLQGMAGGAHRAAFDGFVALGCVIRGQTSHYDHVCQESARGLQDLAVQHGAAIGFGILTCDNGEQAWERAKVDRRNKGAVAAAACLRMIEIKRALVDRRSAIPGRIVAPETPAAGIGRPRPAR